MLIEVDALEVEGLVMLPHILVVEGKLLLVEDGVAIIRLSQVDLRQRPLMRSSQVLFRFAITLHLCYLILALLILMCLHISPWDLTCIVMLYLCLSIF